MRELVRALAKVILLYAPQMKGEAAVSGTAPLSLWGPAWRSILDCLVAAMTQVCWCVIRMYLVLGVKERHGHPFSMNIHKLTSVTILMHTLTQAAPRSEFLAEAIPDEAQTSILNKHRQTHLCITTHNTHTHNHTQAAPRSELLAEAIPEATKNMVLMLLNKVGSDQNVWIIHC